MALLINEQPSTAQCTSPTVGTAGPGRSPKRAKSTPSPVDRSGPLASRSLNYISTSSSSSSRSRESRVVNGKRPGLEGKRGLSFGKHTAKSPWRGEDEGWSMGRRREMSVPLLSESLSSFSLSQSPSNDDMSQAGPSRGTRQTSGTAVPFVLPSSPPNPTSTPRRHPIRHIHTPSGESTSRSHVHPSTAPLPQMSSFLGSPFSSKRPPGRYTFSTMSPSKGAQTEMLRCDGFQTPNLDWLSNSEWMVEEALDENIDHSEHGDHFSDSQSVSSKMRREKSGSLSSVDEFSGESGTSSTSLRSLGRSSGEHQDYYPRPNFISVWGERGDEYLDGEDDPATPSKPFQSHSEVKDQPEFTTSASATTFAASPLGSRGVRGHAVGEMTPLQAFLMSRTPSGNSPMVHLGQSPSPSPAKPRSPLASFFPRLLSSKKSQKEKKQQLSVSVSTESSPTTSIRADLESPPNSSTIGLGIGLGTRTGEKKAHFARTVSSATTSSDDANPSPSKPPSTLNSSTSTVPTLPPSPLSHPTAPVLLTRRKTLAIQHKITPKTHPRKRPGLRRGITEPGKPADLHRLNVPTPGTSTPVAAMFADVKPSPAAFASTGLVKKKSILPGLEIPKFGEINSAPVKRNAQPMSPVEPVKSRLPLMAVSGHRPRLSSSSIVPSRLNNVVNTTHTARSSSSNSTSNSNSASTNTSTSNTTDGSVSVYARAAQKNRGLRRKTSSMFAASASSGSIGEVCGIDQLSSPLTPTRPGIKLLPIEQGVTTPSPTTPNNVQYPFAPSSNHHPLISPYQPTSQPTIGARDASSPAERASARGQGNFRGLLRDGPLARASNPMLAASFRAQAMIGSTTQGGSANKLNRDFVIMQSLGRGEFSQVWKVKEKKTGRMYAVKAGRAYTGTKNRLRQLEEVSILHRLSLSPHDNIVTFIDSWEFSNRLYIRTELAPCGDLAMFLLSLGDVGGMGEARVWKTLRELSLGLSHIHSNDFLHLDIKPSNVLITNAGSLLIADFGMSTMISPDSGVAGDVSPALPQFGEDGAFVWGEDANKEVRAVPSPILDREVEGDREYLCPEALDGVVGKEADVFSLGLLVMEAALNVVLPPNGDGWIKLRSDDFSDLTEHYTSTENIRDEDDSRCHEEPAKDQQEAVPEVSTVLISTIKGMMSSDPAKRMTLEQIRALGPMVRLAGMVGKEGVSAALVEESKSFLRAILAE